MATELTLDEINAAVEADYGSLDIPLGNGEKLSLRNPLRLSKAERKQLGELQKDDEDEDRDVEDELLGMIRLVAADKEVAEKFIGRYGDDLATISFVLKRYTAQVKLGEA